MPTDPKDRTPLIEEAILTQHRLIERLTDVMLASTERGLMDDVLDALRESAAAKRPPDVPPADTSVGFLGERRLLLEYNRLRTDLGRAGTASVYVGISRIEDGVLLTGPGVATGVRVVAWVRGSHDEVARQYDAELHSLGGSKARATFDEFVPEGSPIEVWNRHGDPVAFGRWTQPVSSYPTFEEVS